MLAKEEHGDAHRKEEEDVMVFTRENRGGSAQQTRNTRKEELFVIVPNEDPSNAHQAQHRPVQATGAMTETLSLFVN